MKFFPLFADAWAGWLSCIFGKFAFRLVEQVFQWLLKHYSFEILMKHFWLSFLGACLLGGFSKYILYSGLWWVTFTLRSLLILVHVLKLYSLYCTFDCFMSQYCRLCRLSSGYMLIVTCMACFILQPSVLSTLASSQSFSCLLKKW